MKAAISFMLLSNVNLIINKSNYIYSSGTNGLVKLWTIKSNECVKTFDEHEDKVWALAVHETENTFITGGADSNLIIWKVC